MDIREARELIQREWPDWKLIGLAGHGRGSYGTVFEIQKNFDDSYAIRTSSAVKIITIPNRLEEIDAMKSFGMTEEQAYRELQGKVREYTREIELMESVRGQTNIVNIEDWKVVEERDRNPWEWEWHILIRMEMLKPLDHWVKERQGIGEKEVIRIGCDICRALELCQEKGIVHRDIKPSNILVNDRGDFKLGDFGVSRQLQRTTMSFSIKGTPNYMAPELNRLASMQITLKDAVRVDIYSLGLVLYFYMNGSNMPFYPYPSNSLEAAFGRRISGEKLPPPMNASPELSRIILKACAYQPEERYASASEMLRELEALSEPPEYREKPKPVNPPAPTGAGGGENNQSKTATISSSSGTGMGSRTRPLPPMPPYNGQKEGEEPYQGRVVVKPANESAKKRRHWQLFLFPVFVLLLAWLSVYAYYQYEPERSIAVYYETEDGTVIREMRESIGRGTTTLVAKKADLPESYQLTGEQQVQVTRHFRWIHPEDVHFYAEKIAQNNGSTTQGNSGAVEVQNHEESTVEVQTPTETAAEDQTASTATAVQPPVITNQPQNASAQIGDTVTFKAIVDGADAYQWQYNAGDGWGDISRASTWAEGQNSDTLVVRVSDQTKYYIYRLIASHGSESVISEEVGITVMPASVSPSVTTPAETKSTTNSSGGTQVVIPNKLDPSAFGGSGY